ncbi:inner centromere [Brachionus plicatilis]|uniref:Inner centromere n=1 Tax=Brachionus plicatilis TaxID=10195 RepID=A0A3M7SGW6_BRAPC|nr:inner centromere [Brachionus plicatilis]
MTRNIFKKYSEDVSLILDKNATIIVINKSKNPVRKRSNSADARICKPQTENYDIQELGSSDETDDEDEPSKPIPEWAKDCNKIPRVQAQARFCINFTKLFKATTNENVVLENIFKEKKPRFGIRSSSAEWITPPVWKTGGLNGDESFRKNMQNFFKNVKNYKNTITLSKKEKQINCLAKYILTRKTNFIFIQYAPKCQLTPFVQDEKISNLKFFPIFVLKKIYKKDLGFINPKLSGVSPVM